MDEQNEIMEWLGRNKNTIGIVAVGLLLAILFLKKPKQQQQETLPTGDYSGLAVDEHGRPIIYRETASTFINVTEGSYNTVAPNPSQPVASAPSPPDTESPVEWPIEPTGFIRTRYNDPLVNEYDRINTQGVPIRATPAGTQVAFAPFGSEITLLGEPVSGGSNLPSYGSNLWFPVQGGYISKYDLDVVA